MATNIKDYFSDNIEKETAIAVVPDLQTEEEATITVDVVEKVSVRKSKEACFRKKSILLLDQEHRMH